MKCKEEDSLAWKDFAIFDKALKLSWVKRLCLREPVDAPWKYIPKFLLRNVVGVELFNCNYHYKRLALNENLPSFDKEIILHWQEILSTLVSCRYKTYLGHFR